MRPFARVLLPVVIVLFGAWAGASAVALAASAPHVILVSVDTLRTDRMSGYGHFRNTSPNIDSLLAAGARFSEARTPAPLTAPAMASVMTSLHPHEHGSTRNGLRVRPNLVSLGKILSRRGYKTGGFVGNWTLKPELSGLAEHFDDYEALLNRKRWFGLAKREATAGDISDLAMDWLEGVVNEGTDNPVFLWVHYVEPHAPYRLRRDFLKQIGVKAGGTFFSARNRYDSEIAYVDDQIGKFLARIEATLDPANTLIVFVADHGESMGEHGYWGHGRHLYDVTLRVPMGFVLPGVVEASVVDAPASILDIAPTVLSLVDLPVPEHFQGVDWGPVLQGFGEPDYSRTTWHQAHRSSVQPKEDIEDLRQRGLLEVARVVDGEKEVIRVTNQRRRIFELEKDPKEKVNLAASGTKVSDGLSGWLQDVRVGLATADELPPPSLTDDDVAALRALGYID